MVKDIYLIKAGQHGTGENNIEENEK